MKTIYHGGISGGKDSAALAGWVKNESGLPLDSIDLTFCDTGNEAKETLEYVQWISENVLPVTVLRPEKDFYELAKHKGRFPSARARFCTHELKIKPTMAHVKQLQDAGHEVVLLSGVRAGESRERASLPEREYNEIYDCEMWRPLLRWSIDDVWAALERYCIPRNPLYAMGAERVGCLPCVMSRKSEIAVIARQFPERIDRIRQAERDGKDHLGGLCSFFSPSKVPIRYRVTERHEIDKMIPAKDYEVSGLFADPASGEGYTYSVPEHTEKRVIALSMIDDVVKWALDEHAVEQGELGFDADLPATCADKWGYCE